MLYDGHAPMHEILLSVLFQHFNSHVASTKAQYVQNPCDIPERYYSQTGITIPVKKPTVMVTVRNTQESCRKVQPSYDGYDASGNQKSRTEVRVGTASILDDLHSSPYSSASENEI